MSVTIKKLAPLLAERSTALLKPSSNLEGQPGGDPGKTEVSHHHPDRQTPGMSLPRKNRNGRDTLQRNREKHAGRRSLAAADSRSPLQRENRTLVSDPDNARSKMPRNPPAQLKRAGVNPKA